MKKINKINFEVSERKILLRVFDVITVVISLFLVGLFFEMHYIQFSVSNYYCLILIALYINIVGSVFEMYNLQVASNQFKVLRSTILTTSITFLFYLLTPVFSAVLPKNRVQLVVFYFTILFGLLIWRTFYVHFLASNRFVQNVLLVCDKNQLEHLILDLEKSDPHYKIIAYVNSSSDTSDTSEYNYVQHVCLNDFFSFVNEKKRIEIVVASKNTDDIAPDLYIKLLHLLEAGVTIREYTQVYEDKNQRIPLQFISRDFYKFFPFNRSNNNKLYLLQVRLVEFFLSVIGLLVCVFLIPLILVGNFLGNRGKLFYTQERVGQYGKIFHILKFRSMVSNSDLNEAIFLGNCSARITPFGKFMRKTRMDEFPQFINILKGDMAVIGPRPERPYFVKQISKKMPFYETRHIIKPGLTGWAQVNYSYGESIEESIIKLQYDLYYIKHRSVFLDLNITLKTFSTILFYRGQ
jgi:exopolysaccharide biosynthesis polyprenyl glycosylphosphotransferase